MNALALSQLACAAHATIVLLPQFTATSYIDAGSALSLHLVDGGAAMIAMMLRETGAHGARRFSSVEFVRMGSAPVSEA